ncbi:serine/threonine-protein kinase [Polyangium sorediatum]|uniref:Serine/threonine-protein kinase n=1 Tax=Polyangium sorediatum TaxID=889274 RepID=A0ABT6NXD9_9BACT|nr:serine/threonine-protein kinase [Polyangium sorediatum]MDI1433019.1 serine/threonine-protein kinase [Polyangium sorediatum]
MIGRQLLTDYEIVRVLGQGGMGTVYEARSTKTGQRVAIKWLHVRPFAPDDPDLLRFEQEARIAGSLDSPHVVAAIAVDHDPESGVPFQVMELLDGEDVRALLGRVGPLRPDVALRILAQACEGLAAAHAVSVIHRDIKPENLFLARGGDGEVTVKLLDFGVAKIRRTPEAMGAGGALTAPAVSMTQSGQVIGTPLYMAPEQIESPKKVDARCDVYSMGVTLYAMLAGAPPHAHVKSLVELLYAITTQPPQPLAESAPWVPAEIVRFVEKATAHAREDRFPSVEAMRDALRPLLPEGFSLRQEALVGVTDEERKIVATHPANPLVASAKTERSAETVKTARARAGRARLAAAAITLLVLGLAAFFLWSR